ncbi:hypothetical protein BJY04DRAFT_201609 [Aspergillus karnatakaensis]|uniref:uncharacterized protein n=1 Tax=Aspergillus karnatakaensis TaxID=1810916 RepID=UPI003CCE0701
MPKLAVPPLSAGFNPSRLLRCRPRPNPASRCASSHTQTLAQPRTHHVIPPSVAASSNQIPLLQPRPPFDFKYSLTDDLNPQNQNDHKPPDERTLKLGKTLRVLSPLLPTILVNPLPPHILSPSVALHLFPSTHPHLPTVRGRTLYRAALWAVPVAWSSVPLVGNVKLQILSERIVRAGTVLDPHLNDAAHTSENGDCGDERLVVRWRTERTHSTPSSAPSAPSGSTAMPSESSTTSANAKDDSSGTNKGLSVLLGGDAPIFKLSNDQFTGLFIFSFDDEGRVLTQTIEHAEDASGWERTAKFVTLTDWLIGKARSSLDPNPAPGLAGVGCTGSSSGSVAHRQDREKRSSS